MNFNKINGFPKVVTNVKKIPNFLQQRPCAVWLAEPREGQPGKFGKAPRNPVSGIKIGANNPDNFGTFEQAVAALDTGRYSGIGVLLTGDGTIGVDIDDYETTFAQMPQVRAWVAEARKAGAYCELSPSSKGLRLFMRAKLPGSGRKVGPLEIYGDARFLTVTGKAAKGCGMELIDGQALVDEFLAMLPPKVAAPAIPMLGTASADIAQVEELATRMATKHGELWARNCEARPFGEKPDFVAEQGGNLDTGNVRRDTSPSGAEMALCGHIAREAVRMGVAADALSDTVWRTYERSGLYEHDEDKADRKRKVTRYTIPKVVAEVLTSKAKATHRIEGRARLPLDSGLIEFSNTPPPPRDFVIQDLMLACKTCLLAGFGGVSKTQLMLSMAVCVALGLPFFGKKTVPGCVLLLLGEEDAGEVSRRMNAIAAHLRLTPEQRQTLRERVRAFPMIGLDMRLTKAIAGNLEGSGLAQEINEAGELLAAETAVPVRLIGLDHAGLIHGGEFNSREDVVQTMRQVNYIGDATGAAVMVLAHSPKGAANDDRALAGAVAGSTAWVDHARSALILRAMDDREGKQFGIDPEARTQYASLTVVKNNYGPTGEQFWAKRVSEPNFGVAVLDRVVLTVPPKTIKGSDASVRAEIAALVRDKPCLTKNALEGYAGKSAGRIRAGKAAVMVEVNSMLAEGVLTLRQPTAIERTKLGIKGPTSGFLTMAQGG